MIINYGVENSFCWPYRASFGGKIMAAWLIKETSFLIKIKLQVFELKVDSNKNYNDAIVIDNLTGDCMQ